MRDIMIKCFLVVVGLVFAVIHATAAEYREYRLAYDRFWGDSWATIYTPAGTDISGVGLINLRMVEKSEGTLPLGGLDYWTYCVDASIPLDTGSRWYREMSYEQAMGYFNDINGGLGGISPSWLNNDNGIRMAGWIYNEVKNGRWGSNSGLYPKNPYGLTRPVSIAGQVAIWEVLYDGRPTATSSTHIFTNPMVKDLNNFRISSIDGIDADGDHLNDTLELALSMVQAAWNQPILPTSSVLVPLDDKGGTPVALCQEFLFSFGDYTPRIPDGGWTLVLLGLACCALRLIKIKPQTKQLNR